MITNFKIYESRNDTPEYLWNLKIGDKVVFNEPPSNYLDEGETYIINYIVRYKEYNGHRYYENVDKIVDGDVISVKTENGYVVVDYHGNDSEPRLFFPSKFTTPEMYNIINVTKKFNL